MAHPPSYPLIHFPSLAKNYGVQEALEIAHCLAHKFLQLPRTIWKKHVTDSVPLSTVLQRTLPLHALGTNTRHHRHHLGIDSMATASTQLKCGPDRTAPSAALTFVECFSFKSKSYGRSSINKNGHKFGQKFIN